MASWPLHRCDARNSRLATCPLFRAFRADLPKQISSKEGPLCSIHILWRSCLRVKVVTSKANSFPPLMAQSELTGPVDGSVFALPIVALRRCLTALLNNQAKTRWAVAPEGFYADINWHSIPLYEMRIQAPRGPYFLPSVLTAYSEVVVVVVVDEPELPPTRRPSSRSAPRPAASPPPDRPPATIVV